MIEKKWLFKVNGKLYTKTLDMYDLKEVKNYLEFIQKYSGNFIELDNTLVNINQIEQVCEAHLFENGTIDI